jgi:hypothetical protein
MTKKTQEKKLIKYDDNIKVYTKPLKDVEYQIVIGIQNGAKVNKQFLENIIFFAKKHKANITALPLKDHNESFKNQTVNFDPWFLSKKITIANEFVINDNLMALDAQLLPQALNPLTGIHRLGLNETGDKKRSVIVSHTKLDLDVIETGFNSHPRIICTSGVITNPNYLTNKRIGKLAKTQHKLGFVLVKKENNKIFNLVQIEANKDGSFYHNGSLYKNGKITKAVCDVVLGDHHGIEIHPKVLKVMPEIFNRLNPRTIYDNDSFDGMSVNAHEKDSHVTRHKIYNKIGLNVERELKETIAMEKVLYGTRSIVKVPSNHCDWIDRRLEEGEYPKDPINTVFMHKLALNKLLNDNIETLECAYRLIDSKHADNITFPNRRVELVSFGNTIHHGDVGRGGGKGSIAMFDATIGRSINGHTHKVRRFGNAVDTGHLTHGKQSYLKGLKGWIMGYTVIYPTGAKQLFLIIEDHKTGKIYNY